MVSDQLTYLSHCTSTDLRAKYLVAKSIANQLKIRPNPKKTTGRKKIEVKE